MQIFGYPVTMALGSGIQALSRRLRRDGLGRGTELLALYARPVGRVRPGILAHMNTDHADAMILLAKSRAGIEASEAMMTSVDRLGFTLRLKTSDGVKGTRFNFAREVATPQDSRAVLVELSVNE